MNEMSITVKSAARAYYEAHQAFEQAKEYLKPLAKQQIDITRKVASECGLGDHYNYRPCSFYDWIELSVGDHYVGSSDTPVIQIELWYRGRCGDSDSREAVFELDDNILNGEPEKFELALRKKLENASQKKAREDRELKERQIAALQAQIEKLEGELK